MRLIEQESIMRSEELREAKIKEDQVLRNHFPSLSLFGSFVSDPLFFRKRGRSRRIGVVGEGEEADSRERAIDEFHQGAKGERGLFFLLLVFVIVVDWLISFCLFRLHQ